MLFTHEGVLKGLDVIVNTAHRRRFKVANAGGVDSLGTVRLRLRLGQWEDREHVFHVLPNLVCDCLLGVPWLNTTGAAVRGTPNGLMLCPPLGKHGRDDDGSLNCTINVFPVCPITPG